MTRIAIALIPALAAFQIGLRYTHLCDAGVKWLEATMAFGVPLLIAVVVAWGGLRKSTVAITLLLITFSAAFQRPYLNWAHGDATRLEGALDQMFLPTPLQRIKYDLKNGQSKQAVASLLQSDGEPFEPEANFIEARINDVEGWRPSDEFYRWTLVDKGERTMHIILQFRFGRLINFRRPG